MGKSALSDLTFRCAAILGLCAAILWMASCTASGKPESDQQIQHQAQRATENARVAAQKAAADARVAAAQAERTANDVAKGVKDGLHNGKTANGAIDVNSATLAQLESLPGVTAATARRIEAHRPYEAAADMVRKGAVSQDEYDRIAGDVVTR
ncbi:MAG TPA: helix-hairpin-helix domain-containing protein [Acidobacteriaceae bacterium]|nr:helix-hairpin-helix domain-containing protein [Acidobacteriaceae bacterium]